MFLVGGFSESQKRIKQEFSHQINDISIKYENMKCVISSRALKYTYGIKTTTKLAKKGRSCT
ncbi:hypothetical protein RhiirA4_489391 [Rhizophagus irregularis]|uniref:Uncharacterized protein n=1 Tax=Rhizophagus irregularis TaxID=588596 RepID=A0A2I1HUQ1_9GLOM|nr:hypothetical protein RhiirA4_489391 [Rhizophagus irregularis]